LICARIAPPRRADGPPRARPPPREPQRRCASIRRTMVATVEHAGGDHSSAGGDQRPHGPDVVERSASRGWCVASGRHSLPLGLQQHADERRQHVGESRDVAAIRSVRRRRCVGSIASTATPEPLFEASPRASRAPVHGRPRPTDTA
jgi:hypothetical protein